MPVNVHPFSSWLRESVSDSMMILVIVLSSCRNSSSTDDEVSSPTRSHAAGSDMPGPQAAE